MSKNPKLTILFEKMRGRVFELDKDVMTAGRREGVDIVIKEGSLSSHHCDFIRTESGSYILRDNNSTNGTRVNNEPVTERELQNSDIIQLGAVEMLYDCEDDGATSANLRTHTIDLNNIALNNLSTTRELKNFSPFEANKLKKQKRQHAIMLIIIIVLAIAVLGVLGMLLMKMLGH